MPTLPSTLPRYASGATGDAIFEPPDQKKTDGWVFNEPVGHDVWNWILKYTYQWILFFSETVGSYTDLQTAVEARAEGDTFLLDEHDADKVPGSTKTTTVIGAAVVSVAATGKSVLFATATAGYARGRNTTTAVATYTPSNAGTVSRIFTNGEIVVLKYGNYIEAYTHDTGASLWSYNHGAAVHDVAIDSTQAYLCGEEGTGSFHVRAISILTGAAAWGYRHSAGVGHSVRSICTTGQQVIFSGSASSYLSGASLRSITASAGHDFDAEGTGVADTTTYLAWNVVQPTITGGSGMLQTDGIALYAAYYSAAAKQVEIRSLVNGVVVADLDLVSRGVVTNGIVVDHDGLFIVSDAGSAPTVVIERLDKRTLARVWRRVQTVERVVTDGAALFGFSSTNLYRNYRGNRARIWRRASPDDYAAPYRRLAYAAD